MCSRQVIVSFVGFAALCLASASCASNTASIEQSWSSPTARRGELRNVVTVFDSHDESLRRSAEDKLAEELRRHGVLAVPSYRLLTVEALRDLPGANAKLQAAGFDGVVAMRVVGKKEQVKYLPVFHGRRGMLNTTVIRKTVVRIETDAYSLVDDQLIWTARSTLVDPDVMSASIDDITQVVTRALGNQGLLAAKSV